MGNKYDSTVKNIGIDEVVRTAQVDFGKTVRAHRTAKGWTQADLAERAERYGMHLGQATIAKLESGNRPTSVGELFALGELFGVKPSELLAPPAEPEPQATLTLQVETALRQMRAMETELIDVAFRYQFEQYKARTVAKYAEQQTAKAFPDSDMKRGQFLYLRDALQIMIERSATEVVNANSENQMALVPVEEYVALVEQVDRPQAPRTSKQVRHGIDQETS